MSYRPSRVAEAFKEEIMEIIQRELKDPRIGFVTVTQVVVTQDLRYATIFLSVLGDEEQKQKTLEGLERAKGYIRSELGKRVRMKYLPELRFEIDSSLEESFRVDEIIKKLKKKGEN